MVFWGAIPHHLIHVATQTHCTWLTLPLVDFLQMALPKGLVFPILRGEPLLENHPSDLELFARWLEDASNPKFEHRRIFDLELEARLRRLAMRLPKRRKHARSLPLNAATAHAAKLARHISESYLQPIRLEDIALAAGLHVNYASTVFKQVFAVTLLEYLNQHRLAHAQRLLATTEQGVLEVAFASGFGSSSRFYDAFTKATGTTPLKYRNGLIEHPKKA